jgi:hypothetical protein
MIRDTRDDVCKVKGLRTHKYVGCEGEGGGWSRACGGPEVLLHACVTVAGGACMVL